MLVINNKHLMMLKEIFKPLLIFLVSVFLGYLFGCLVGCTVNHPQQSSRIEFLETKTGNQSTPPPPSINSDIDVLDAFGLPL